MGRANERGNMRENEPETDRERPTRVARHAGARRASARRTRRAALNLRERDRATARETAFFLDIAARDVAVTLNRSGTVTTKHSHLCKGALTMLFLKSPIQDWNTRDTHQSRYMHS